MPQKATKSLVMNGNKKLEAIAQERDRKLLALLPTLRFVDIRQAAAICGFGSAGRARARIAKLVKAEYLGRFHVGTIAGGRKAIYTLPELLPKVLTHRQLASVGRELFVAHHLAVNDVYLAAAQSPNEWNLVRWEQFHATSGGLRGIIPDAYLEIGGAQPCRGFFLEMDMGSESLTVWQRKVERYLDFAGRGDFRPLSGLETFGVLVVAQTEGRIKAIQKLIARSTDRVFYLATTRSLPERGFWSNIWLRPLTDQTVSLAPLEGGGCDSAPAVGT